MRKGQRKGGGQDRESVMYTGSILGLYGDVNKAPLVKRQNLEMGE